MSAYTSRPPDPMERDAAIDYLWEKFQVDATDAGALLSSAVESPSGMAPLEREGAKTLWATCMTTLGGKFIIETAWPLNG